ncbi:Striatin-interacting protein 2 [Plecturocebus cupreus]
MEDLAAPGNGVPPANGNGNGNGGGKGKQAAPKGREAFRSQRRESEVRSPESFGWGPGDARGREAAAEAIRPWPRSPRRASSAPRSGRLRGPRCWTLGSAAPTLVRKSPAAGWGLSSPVASSRCTKMRAILSGPNTLQILISLNRCSSLKKKFRSQFIDGGKGAERLSDWLEGWEAGAQLREGRVGEWGSRSPAPRLPAAGPGPDPHWLGDFGPSPARPLLPGSVDCPTLEFEYGDADGHAAELSELYSYTESLEFTNNRRCFEEDFKTQVQGKEWLELEEDAQKAYIMGLLDRLEVVSREQRLKVARAVLYLAQGTFGECDSEVDVLHWSRYNCFLLYQMGTFSTFLELLRMEIDNSQACSSALRKPAVSIADSTELRVLLSVMYLMVENIRLERETDPCGWRTARETFRTELSFFMHNEEPFALLLFSMVTKFCSGLAPHFPIKKVLLLLWKVVMFTLGGFEHLQTLKVQKRAELGLPPLAEDSIQVVKSMRAASPPSYTLDLGESQLAPPPSKLRGRRGSRRQLLTKQDSLDIYNERDLFKTEEPAAEEEEESAGDGERTLDGELDLLEQDPLVPPPPSQAPLSAERVAFPKGLPWAPKVRQKDIEHFLEMSRNKFIGFTLGQDTDTLVGLPRPIHESVKTLKQHKYISIADVQIKNEEELEKCPMSLGEEVVPETPCEILYQGMLYSLPQYMIALLKILLAAAPTSKAKTDSINILADVLPEEMPITVLQSMKLGIDVNRHKEIIVKSISTLLLLLLKHFKLNHIYQFEYVSQHLVFANCIPLILKFFNQNILSYITAKNSISVLDYPCCTIQDLPELTTESLVSSWGFGGL